MSTAEAALLLVVAAFAAFLSGLRRIGEVLLMAGFGLSITAGIGFFLWLARTFLAPAAA